MILPKDFERYFSWRWRSEDVDALIAGLDREPSVSIRVNPMRLPLEALPECADGRVPWCPEGFYLKERPPFTADPLLHAGAYYVQEASSMFLAHVVRSIFHSSFFTFHAQAVLDLCAAPGGKSTILRSHIPDDCLLVSNEPNRSRCQVLAENMTKWGHPNVVVTQAYAEELARIAPQQFHLTSGFDIILADVPCSGEGMMRKEEEAVRQWSPALVHECAALQRSIITDIWPALRPGGLLIYSTCTFNPEEDEENVEWVARELGADILTVPVDPTWGIRGDLRKGAAEDFRFCHFLPGSVRGEGFFLAVLRKEESGEDSYRLPNPRKIKKNKKELPLLTTLPTDVLDAPQAPTVNLSLPDALRYLQREALILPDGTPKGIVQVCYAGQRLGLVNNLGSRANNLYPKEWRIRSGYTVPHTLFPTLEKTV